MSKSSRFIWAIWVQFNLFFWPMWFVWAPGFSWQFLSQWLASIRLPCSASVASTFVQTIVIVEALVLLLWVYYHQDHQSVGLGAVLGRSQSCPVSLKQMPVICASRHISLSRMSVVAFDFPLVSPCCPRLYAVFVKDPVVILFLKCYPIRPPLSPSRPGCPMIPAAQRLPPYLCTVLQTVFLACAESSKQKFAYSTAYNSPVYYHFQPLHFSSWTQLRHSPSL